ncbi:endonuclease [Flavobacterium magnum]|uniref:Endonuclease n=1 Tax=Flavobacterium magnum TaxID=2162713 RepID=A0A2S0RFB1_9FLAO|nr:DNA-formamidopyrimidine glycosylase family protein [Flavobacterium magnum]AWA30344.1 endonuclease [Flavobacterium magnum]
MPEGPTIVILREQLAPFTGEKVTAAHGTARIDLSRLEGQHITAFKSWGKHCLICVRGFSIRIHLLMFGSYRINDHKDVAPRIGLTFNDGEINFYTCAVKLLEGDVNDHYDWTADVMNDNWNARLAKKKLAAIPEQMICDALLEQDIFSGVGNIIKNEVLYRVRLHPESLCGSIPDAKLRELIREARQYSFEFLEWKKKSELKKHWLAYTKKTCKRCNLPFAKKYTGTGKRRSFFCAKCQKLHHG